MPVTVNIDGVGKVQLDDSFKSLSAADQQSTVDEIASQHAPAASPTPAPSMAASAIRGITNAATFNLAPVLAAAGDAALPLSPSASHAPTLAQRYKENLAFQTSQDQAAAHTHPAAMIGGEIAGGFANPVMRALPVAKTFLGAVGQGAGLGAGYGAGTAISNQDSLPQAAKDIGEGAALGGAVPAALPILGAVAKGGAKALAHGLGLTTGVGAKPIQAAFEAGAAGGDQAQAFTSNMRGSSSWEDVVDQAKSALGQIRADRNAAYRSGMVDISRDPTVLSFDPVDKAMSEATAVKTFKGQDLSKSTADVRQQIQQAVDNWKGLDPAEYHTPEGFDALKQQIGDIRDNIPFNTPQRVVADKAYNAIRQTISDQAPAYSKVMSDYSQASDAVDAIQKELSLGPKGNPGTAMRKLQSVMRDNVNTSYGNRATYADALQNAGATTLIPSLAGQSMSALVPRGLGRVLGGAELGATVLAPGLALKTGGLLAASSPRLVGEAAYGLGKTAGALGSLPRVGGLTSANVRSALSAPSIAALVPAMLPRLPN